MPRINTGITERLLLLRGSSAVELDPEIVRQSLEGVIELAVAAFIDANRHQRTGDRLFCNRNGCRPSHLCGYIDLQISKLRNSGLSHVEGGLRWDHLHPRLIVNVNPFLVLSALEPSPSVS